MQQSAQQADSILEEIFQDLPAEFEELAAQTKALQRARKIKTPRQLLRMVLLYCGLDFSGRQTAATMTALYQPLSDTAIFERLKRSKLWLQTLISRVVEVERDSLSEFGFKLSLVDGTMIVANGSHQSDYRLHLKLDLRHLHFEHVEVTSARVAESLARYQFSAGELVLGDRNFARATELVRLTGQGVQVLVRFSAAQLKLSDAAGKPIKWGAESKVVGNHRYESWPCYVQDQQGARAKVYVHRYRLSQSAYERVKLKLRRRASKKGQKLKGETVELARFVWVVTNVALTELDARAALQLYRVRWQIELGIKRLKSLLQLGHLKSKAGSEIAEVWLLGKLLSALLLQRRHQRLYGKNGEIELGTARRQTGWREWQLLLEPVRALIVSSFYWRTDVEPEMRQALRERKRRRGLQHLPREVLHWLQPAKIDHAERNTVAATKDQWLLSLVA